EVRNADPRGRAWVGQRTLRVIRPEQHPDRFRDGGLPGYAGGYEVGADGRLRDRGKTMETGGRVRTERRLAAILAADVAGYSRLIGADEEGTREPAVSHPRGGRRRPETSQKRTIRPAG